MATERIAMLSRRKFLKTQAAGVALPLALSGASAKGEIWAENSTALPGGPEIQSGQPQVIDCHHHYNGDPAYLNRLVAKLDGIDGMAFLLTPPPALQTAKKAIDQ